MHHPLVGGPVLFIISIDCLGGQLTNSEKGMNDLNFLKILFEKLMDDAVQVTPGSTEHARHSTSTQAIKRFHPTKRSRRVFICLDSKKPGNLDSLNRYRFPLGFHQEGLGGVSCQI